MECHIREARAEDYGQVNAIVKEGQDEHAKALPHIFRAVETVMPYDYFASLLASESEHLLVAELDEQVVGFLVIEAKNAPPFESLVSRRFAYIHDFGVRESCQRKGIGNALFAASQDWAKAHGASSLELNVWSFNERAIRFYETLGMEQVSVKMQLAL